MTILEAGVRCILLLFAVCLVVCGTTAQARAAGRAPAEKKIDWIGVSLGGGIARYKKENSPHTTPSILHTAIHIADLSWRWFYITPLEIHPTVLFGYLGGGTRLGIRIPLTTGFGHELRVGSFVGAEMHVFTLNIVEPLLSVRPHLQWIWNAEKWSLGLGLDLTLHAHFQDQEIFPGDGVSVYIPHVMVGLLAYIRIAFWRTVL